MSSTHAPRDSDKQFDSDLQRGARIHRHVRATPLPHPLDPDRLHRQKTWPQNDQGKARKLAQPPSLPHHMRTLYTLGLVVNYSLQRATALTEEAGRASKPQLFTTYSRTQLAPK